MDFSTYPNTLFRRWPPASPHLSSLAAFPDVVIEVTRVTMNRACLLAELPPSALGHICVGPSGYAIFAALSLAQISARKAHPPPWPRERFVATPPSAAMSSAALWADRVRLGRPDGWSWLEVAAAGGISSPASFTVALEEIFDESHYIKGLGPHRASFADRCVASSCSTLIPRFTLDEKAEHRPTWAATPRQRIASALAESHPYSKVAFKPLDSASGSLPPHWRFPGLLSLEASIRTQLASVKGSWRSLNSALMAWSFHMSSVDAFADPFAVNEENLASFALKFSNGDTFKAYLGHLRAATRLIGRSFPSALLTSALVRGARKFAVSAERPALLSGAVRQLIVALLRQASTSLARICAIARQFLLRVADELFPLQTSGRTGLASDSLDWHSAVVFSANSATIILRTRKNEPRGAQILRHCACAPQHPLLCGVCCLRASVADAANRGVGPRGLIFDSSAASSLAEVRACCSALGLGRPGWHSFRRGMARDLLNSGASLPEILRAGGWRSSAFLRYLLKKDVDAREATEFALADSESDHS